jgi:DNA-binding beta-propeller fold protein YncE
VEATLRDEGIGDVAALVVDPDGGSLYTVSFWSSQAVTEIDPETMAVRQRRKVGGAHYDIALDPRSDRLFVSSYYGSRVRILRTSDLKTVGRIPTGLGTRALATDPSRDLVLVSSAYDGIVTVARASSGEVLRRHRVGGHVKDIAIDVARGRALVASRCGLISIDLEP